MPVQRRRSPRLVEADAGGQRADAAVNARPAVVQAVPLSSGATVVAMAQAAPVEAVRGLPMGKVLYSVPLARAMLADGHHVGEGGVARRQAER